MVLDSTDNNDEVPEGIQLPVGVPVDRIYNKCDLVSQTPSLAEGRQGVDIYLSAKTGAGIALLVDHLKTSVGYQQDLEGVTIARSRHVDALKRAEKAVSTALSQLSSSGMPELAAQDLRDAQQALNEITGEFTSDDLLGRIFSGFCIGK